MSGPAFITLQQAGTVLGSSQPGELQYSHEIIPAQPQAPSGGYAVSTPITFQFTPSQGKWWCPSESHLQITMSIWGTTASATANLAAGAAQSIAPLAPACIFESLQFECNGKQIESIQSNVAQHAALRFRLSNKMDQRASGKVSLWGESDSAGGGGPNDPLPITQTGIDRQRVFNSSRKQTFNIKLPLAIFHQNLCLPQATYTIRANLANSFARVLQTTDQTQLPITVSATNAITAARVQIDALDLICAYSDYGASGQISQRIIVPTNNIYMTTHALSTTSQSDNVNISGLPKSAVKYAFWLQRQSANTGTANHTCSPTEFHLFPAVGRNGLTPAPGPTGSQNPVFGITQFQAQIGGRTGPNPAAQFRYSADENNLMKFYRQYELAAGLLEAEDYDQWLARGPIYMFPQLNIHSVDDVAQDMVIRMERDTTADAALLDAVTAAQPFQVPTNLFVAAINERSIIFDVRGGQVADVIEAER